MASGLFVVDCDIDFFIFRHSCSTTMPKFQKFQRGQNSAEKFWIGINESKKLQNLMKVDKIIV